MSTMTSKYKLARALNVNYFNVYNLTVERNVSSQKMAID